MKVLTHEQMRAADRAAIAAGIPEIVLMENAAHGVLRALEARYSPLNSQRIAIFCGKGNNGGDGLAAARHLGVQRCTIHLLAEPDPAKAPDAALQLRILRAAGVPLVVGALPDLAQHSGAVWLDALFGTGLVRELTGRARAWVDAFDRARGPKLAVDIPSGLHGDTGEVLGAACRADVTVTFVARKRGMATPNGLRHCGRIVVAGLGLP